MLAFMKPHAHGFKSQRQQRQAAYPQVCFVFGGSGGCLRHVGVAVGSVEGPEGRRGPVGGGGERGLVNRAGVTPKHKAAEGVAVGQDDHSLHQLSQRPAPLAQQRLEAAQREDEGDLPRATENPTSLPLVRLVHLDVGAGSEPGLMSQHFVNVVQEAQAWRRGLQTAQPQRVPAHRQEMSRVQLDQVVTVISRRSLKSERKT